MKIEYTETPQTEDIDFLTKMINEETPEFGSAYPFAFFIRDDNNLIIAGCNGSAVFGSIYTDQIWVATSHRNKGLGFKLMEQVHDFGRKQNCSIATVSTMDFQDAQSFYEKLGYVIDFERSGYTRNSKFIYLKRFL